MQTILLTGGAGYIGSHICDILLEQSHYVIVIDNLCELAASNQIPFKYFPRSVTYSHDLSLCMISNVFSMILCSSETH